MKLTNVELYNSETKTTQEFEVNHAERILRLNRNGGWKLPDDGPYIFSFKNGIGFKPNKEQDNGTQEKRSNK